jgi:hypothetical protein
MLAIRASNPSQAKMLLAAGADPLAVCSVAAAAAGEQAVEGWSTPLHAAGEGCQRFMVVVAIRLCVCDFVCICVPVQLLRQVDQAPQCMKVQWQTEHNISQWNRTRHAVLSQLSSIVLLAVYR